MEPTWATRDLPVLDKIVQNFDDHPTGAFISIGEIAKTMDWDVMDVSRAVLALESGGYVELHKVASGGDPSPWFIVGISASARRAVNQWPSAENVVQQLVRALDAAAEHEQDPEKVSKLRQTAVVIGGIARDVVTEVTAKVVTQSMGLG
jgi:hypothetical protein